MRCLTFFPLAILQSLFKRVRVIFICFHVNFSFCKVEWPSSDIQIYLYKLVSSSVNMCFFTSNMIVREKVVLNSTVVVDSD